MAMKAAVPVGSARLSASRCRSAFRAGRGLCDGSETTNLQPAEPYNAFLAVLDRDARDSLAAIQIVLAQATLSSQLIDNLNARSTSAHYSRICFSLMRS